MKQKFKLLFAALMLLMMSNPIWGQTYQKVNSLSIGDEVLLVCDNAGMEFSSYSTSGTVYGIGVAFETAPNGVYPFTVVAGANSGTFAFQDANGNYMYWTSGNSLNKNATLSDKTSWNVSFDNEGNAAITNANTPARQIWWNVSSPRFACYTNKTAGSSYYTTQFYKLAGATSAVATPTFTPAGGAYTETQNVSISCATSGATIYYTTDGTTPTTSSSVYSSAIAVSTTTTIKAMGVKSGMDNSAVTSATYTFPTLMTIAEAKALANNQYAMVQGVVTLIDARNIYIQDATGGIDLYLNTNTVPSGLALGDMVQGYGKKTTFNGLIELTDINGGNESEFSILSSGNVLPLAVKTISEILDGGSDALQSTRVKVENAVLGAINTNGNTTLTQGDDVINIYKIPALTGISEGDNVNVTAVIGYYNAAQLRVTIATDVELVAAPQEPVATPTFTPEAGTYTEAQTVSIACATNGATIHYTTDGTAPTASSAVYSTPISVAETMTIKAMAAKEGMINSEIAEATYTIQPATSYVFNKIYAHNAVTATDTYMIVDVNSGKALTSANGSSSAPTVVAVEINDNQITSSDESLFWKFEAVEGGYVIHPASGNETWLYSTTSNNGVRVGTNDNKVWTLDITDEGQSDYHGFKNNATSRYMGVFNNQDWRTYTTIHNNIKNTQIEIFVLGDAPTPILDPELTVSATQLEGFTYEQGAGPSETQSFVVSGENLTSDIVITAPENFEIALSGDSTFVSAINLPFGEGQVANTTINVRLAAGLLRSTYSGNLTVATAGVETKNIALSGSVTMSNAVATPTFSPAAGTFISTQSISILCETEGATIYYTTNGEAPTTESSVYTTPITVSATTTIKAMAVKENYLDSEVASATYTFPQLMTIAEALALNSNEYALVEGIVTFIDSRNVYVQDATAGIVLYLNSNTVPSSLAIGDEVRGYGRRTTYNGLAELTDINGSSEAAFVIISSDNELPLVTKTIAEIMNDYSGNNMLQSTRVRIENAIIGEINPSDSTPITQDGSTLNIYHIPTVEGMIEGDWVNVIGILDCNNAPRFRVVSADDVEFTHRPTVSVNPGTVSGMTYVVEQGPSEIAYFELSGNYLEDNVYIFPSESFELSTAGGALFNSESPAAVFPPQSGHFSGLKIYCRLKAGLEVGSYNELQNIVSRNADTIQIRLIGTVTENAGGGHEGDYIRISDISQLTNGSQIVFAARYDDNPSRYYAMPNTASGKPYGVGFTSVMSGNLEILPDSITAEETNYNWTFSFDGTNYIFTNADGNSIGYGSNGTDFVVNGEKTAWAVAPYTSDAASMVPNHNAFSIINATTINRGFALNSQHRFGAYAISNMTNSDYNFSIDIFAKSDDSYSLVVAIPTFTPAGGTYYEAQNVTIDCSTPGATIYYTLDGSEPTAESNVYTTPILVSETTTIKAKAIVTYLGSSPIATATYTIQHGLSVTPMTLNGFTYFEGNGPSAEQSFTVSGMNLSNDITITEAEDYEISTTSGDNFNAQETIVLTPSNGTIEETTVYVRLKAGLEIADYNEEISITCVDIDDMTVACNGSVTEEIIGEDYVRVNDLSVLTNGSQVILAARYDVNVLNGYYVMTAATSGKPTGVGSTTTMSGSDEILSSEITNEEAVYAWTVGFDGSTYTFTNASGNMLGYTSGTNFATNGDNTAWMIAQATASDSAAMVPGYTGFTIINQNVDTRAVAMNTSYNFGAYSTSNMTNGNGSDYNFYLDIFIKGQGGDPTVSAPVFSPASGTFYEAQDVTITCATPEAEIFYSLESAEGPWTEYTDAINVDEDMTIWAYAEKEGYNNSAVVSAEYIIRDDVVIIFSQDWEDDWNGWTQVSMEGESEWTIAEHDNNHYAYMNAYNDGINEDWLISPAFDIEAYTNVVLNFRSAMNYNGPDIEVYFSNNYDGIDPTTASWLPLTCDLSQGSWTWTESGEISLDEFTGTNCHIAYKYTSTETEAAGWEIDDIMLTSGVNTMPIIMAAPNYINGFSYTYGEGPSEATTYELSAANLDGEGEILILVTEGFEISLDDETYGEELEIAYADGVITDQPVTVYVRMSEDLEIGEYEAVIMHEGGNAYTEVDLAGEVISAEQPYIDAFMPMYIQGNNGSNNNRVPVAIAVYLENLEPSTTYRYTNQFVDANDGETVAGAGNVIYTNAEGFYRSTNPSLSTEGGYGEFTTDEAGEGFAWFINEPTANTRFTPGNQVYLRIRINDGHDGTTVDQIFSTEDYATVLNFGTENDEYQGTAFYAKSNESPMNFVMMFSSDDDWRPTYSTSIETTGIDFANINQYADFYKEEVAGKDGYFGGIIPNNNEDGINIIWILDMESFVINDYYAENGEWGSAQTANPQGGLDDVIFIDLSDLSVDDNTNTTVDVQIWNTKDEIIVENRDNSEYSMMVYNILGQPVMASEIQGNSTQRFSHNFAAGLYIVTMQNNENKVSAKIIVR